MEVKLYRSFTLTLALVSLLAFKSSAQSRVVSGIIKDSSGEPVPGANILIKGTSTGTVADGDGKYSISVPGSDAILVVSFIGFATQEIAVGNQSTVDFTIKEDATQLQDVVVTALGIERDKKALGYSVQDVKGNDFTVARESNLINNMQGRVAGVQIYKGGTGPGGSSRIVIRGANSLNGNSSPLFVVDGVPFDNNQTATNQSEYGSTDQGQGIQQINPDDIETMTVLKGPEAGALYGNRGANGVILITTKKGATKKGLGATFQSNTSFESPLLMPKLQSQYGQGANGIFNVNSEASWGPQITGQQVTDWTGKTRPMSSDPNDLRNFLQTGVTATNSVSLAGGNEKNTVRLGYTNFNNQGLLPNSTLKREMVTLRATSKLTDRFSVDAKISYTRQDGKNRPQTSGSPSNVFSQYITMPRSIHLTDMDPWKDYQGAMVLWKPASYSTLRNPYWTMNEDFNKDGTDRLLTMIKLEYKLTDWLKVHVRHGMDKRVSFFESASAYGIRNPADGTLNFNSGYNANTEIATETNSDFLFTASKTFNDLNISLSAGGNERNSNYQNVGGNTNNFDFPPIYTLGTGSNPRPYSSKSTLRVNSLYAFANLSYKNYLFLDVTYRNDWTSTLSPKNRSIGYPSVSGSAVLSEILGDKIPSVISFAKIRGGFAQTGGFIDPYQLYPTFTISKGFNNAYSTSTPSILPNPDILPEKVNSFEIGLDLKFAENRIGLEVAYYSRSVTNQIVKLPLQGATGYNFKYVNAGDVQNQGIEFVLSATPIKSSTFNWDAALNFNHNVNTVKQLTAETSRYLLQDDASSRAVRIVADVDRPMGDIYGRDFLYDNQHRLLVDKNTGLPQRSTDKNTLLGNYQPQFTLGFVNNLSYKNFNLGFVIDWRQGGKIFSQSQAYMHAAGNAEATLANRDGGMVVNGVYDDGTPNTIAINSQTYWTAVAGAEPVASLFIYDATNIRLRELTFTYNFPVKILGKLPINRLSLGVVGRNVWMISSNIPGIDPESTFTVTNAQGYENGSYPSYRSMGFNLNVGF